MKFIFTFLYFFIPKSYTKYQIRKSVVFRTKYLKGDLGFFSLLRKVLILQFKATITIIFLPLSYLKTKSKIVVFNAGTTERVRKQRIYFTKKYTHENEIVAANSSFKGKFLACLFRPKMLTFIIRLYLAFSISLFLQLFYKTKIEIDWIFGFYKNLIHLCSLKEKKNLVVYFFLPSSLDTYLCALIGSHWFANININIISSNSLLFSINRYLYLPNAGLKYCSQIQREELSFYTSNNWINVKNIEFWGLEEAAELDLIRNKGQIYDIGIFSSGGWARDNNLLRIKEIEVLRKNPNLENTLFRIFEKILETVIILKLKHNLKVIVYPHPCEREAIRNGVPLPYQSQLDKYDITLDIDGRNSVSKIFEAKVGVASVSTIVFDRLHYNLPGFVYAGTGFKDFLIDPRYLGKYREFCFDSYQSLSDKIESQLNLKMREEM